MIYTHELIGFFGCVLMSAFFSGSEAVLLSLPPDRVRQIIENGGARARAMKFMSERPNELLITILIGNNIVNILAASLATVIASRLFDNRIVEVSTGVTTLIVLIFGEIVPKTVARARAERLSTLVIRFLQIIYYSAYPIVRSFTWFIHKILGKNAQIRGRIVTKDDIEYMVERAEQQKTMDSKQIELLSSILEYPTIKVKDVMVPRSRIKFIDSNSNHDEIIKLIKNDAHSRYPVCDDDLDHVAGFLHIKDLAFVPDLERKNFNVKKYVKPTFYVYEHMKIHAVFDHMNRKKVHMALVKDESGLVVGLVSLEDIVEEIFGEIHDEHDQEEAALQEKKTRQIETEDGVVLEGATTCRDLNYEYEITVPLDQHYSTLSGFLLDLLGNSFPENGQIIVWEGFSFELLKVVDQAILEVRVKSVGGEKHLYSKVDAQNENPISDSVTGIDHSSKE